MNLMEDLMKESVINGIGCLLGQEHVLAERETIIFVHGAGSSHAMWVPQMGPLSKQFNTIAVNLPGHGLGREKGEDTIAGYVRAVRELIDGLGLKNVVLVGLSMGGGVVQEFALTYPDRLKAVILLSTGARLKVMPQMFEIIRNNFEAYLKFLPEFAFSRSTSPEIIRPTIEEARKQKPEVVYGDFKACDGFDVRERVKEIRLPCLIISGTEDKLTPPKLQDYLHEQIAGSKLIRLEDAGHILNVEKPREVNKVITEFIGSLDRN